MERLDESKVKNAMLHLSRVFPLLLLLIDLIQKWTHVLLLSLNLSKLQVLAYHFLLVILLVVTHLHLRLSIIHSIEVIVLDLSNKLVACLYHVWILSFLGLSGNPLLFGLLISLILIYSVLPLLGIFGFSSFGFSPSSLLFILFLELLVILIAVHHPHGTGIILVWTLSGRVVISLILNDIVMPSSLFAFSFSSL